MPTAVSSIIRAATRQPDEPLNILDFCTHERYQTGLALTGHNFYAWRVLDGSIKDWDTTYAPLPSNYSLLNPHEGIRQIPAWLDIDLILSQNKFGQFNIAKQLADQLQVPLISLEHTLPVPIWDASQLANFKKMKGNINIFISEFSRKAWGWSEDEANVIHHGIDTDIFRPLEQINKKKHVLSVVNDWVNRDWCCGFELWRNVTQSLPVFPVGKTPGLSQPARNITELVQFYNEAQIFINTSIISPVPTSLLEAMSCGSAVVSTATCMIPEIIKNGHNGYITNDPRELRRYLEMLLDNPDECVRLGTNARQTITENFNMKNFVESWNDVFNIASQLYFTEHLK